MAADGTLTVLSVEDDPDTQANLHDILELDGYRVEAASSAREVLARVDWSDIDVVLLDRRLPDGNAESLLPRLRQLAPHAAVVVITGHADLDSTVAALRHGAVDYLLKPINPDLLRASLARLRSLKEAEARARQAERLAGIGQMMAVLAHESNNALARARLNLDRLATRVADRPEVEPLVARVRAAHDDLQRLYDEVRTFAAPVTLERRPWDVGMIWRQAWTDLTDLAVRRHAELNTDAGGAALRCRVDAFRLQQVFRNLFENALAVCPEPARILVRCGETEVGGRPALRVAVRDNGPGLTAEQRRRAFEPFYTTKAKGTGLGLAIARRVVEAHGGEISISPEGPGAEFVLILPRAEVDAN